MIERLSRALLLLSCALLLLPAARADDDTLAQFKKYYGTFKDTPSRVEAVLTLEGLESPAVVELLAAKLKDAEPDVARAIVRVFSKFQTRPPVDAMLAVLAKEKAEPVRVAIVRAVAEGKYPDVQAALVPCLSDRSWEVKRRAIQALFATGDTSQAAAIVALCADPEPAVRCEAIETLARAESELVIPHALRSLTDPVWQVRSSALFALMRVRHIDAVEPLIRELQVPENGRLLPEIAEALANLTGNEFGVDPPRWQEWWAQSKAGYVLPTKEGIAFLRSKREARTGTATISDFHKSGAVQYQGIETLSRSIMFVIDVSGSMEALVTEKERFEAGGYASYSRMEICKTELIRTIDGLQPHVNFNILAFATDVDPWKAKLVAANVLNKAAAKSWVGRLEPIGGSSKEDLARAGLAGAASLDKGKTNTYGALMAALNVQGGPRTGGADKTYMTDVDTIFFLSDGRPTVGDYVDTDDILREVTAANQLRKVVLHTIAIGEFEKTFMQRMAEQNGGQFVDLGK